MKDIYLKERKQLFLSYQSAFLLLFFPAFIVWNKKSFFINSIMLFA